ncbi:MAG TPA: glutathione S-transferase N-terminal domain-containing protein [Oligoflexia bacterium]|nr:glutathione S-transferase N-terminal domain-containing protein [Oligoflexia bacterium]
MTSQLPTISSPSANRGELLGLFYSPYTERARWALDHHEVPYKYSEYLMMLGDPLLHWKARSLKSNVTVPFFIHGTRRLGDSYAIAQYADQIGTGSKLFSPNDLAAIDQWNRASEATLGAARAVVVHRLRENSEARLDHLPKLLPEPFNGALRSAAGPIANLAIRYLQKSFQIKDSTAEHLTELRKRFLALRQALGGRPYLLEKFSYADITSSVCVQALEPVEEPYLSLGSAAREAWRIGELAREFSDLIEWRNSLYRKHRTRSAC